jgi:hypothetical protein
MEMPRIAYDKTHPELMKQLNKRGFLNYSFCKDNVEGMEGIARNTFAKSIKRFESKYGIFLLKKKMAIPTPAGNRLQTIYFIEGEDIESLIKSSMGLDWLEERTDCMTAMARHYRRNHLGDFKSVRELAEECRILNYRLPIKSHERIPESQEWQQVTGLSYTGVGQKQIVHGER